MQDPVVAAFVKALMSNVTITVANMLRVNRITGPLYAASVCTGSGLTTPTCGYDDVTIPPYMFGSGMVRGGVPCSARYEEI